MRPRILMINPNSSRHITDGLSSAVECYRSAGVDFDCVTLEEGPAAVVTQLHVAQVVVPLLTLFARHEDRTDALVIACFYDPGVSVLRESTAVPVFGIGESSFYVALSLADRFGVITASDNSSRRI